MLVLKNNINIFFLLKNCGEYWLHQYIIVCITSSIILLFSGFFKSQLHSPLFVNAVTVNSNTYHQRNNNQGFATESLNQEENLTNELIQYSLRTYHQDVINIADFALKSNGASIIHSITSPTFYHIPGWLQLLRWYIYSQQLVYSPEMTISPSTHVGECWSFHGNVGTLGIQLSKPILIQRMTVEYPSCEVMSSNMENAPKKIELFGIPNSATPKKNHVSLGTIEYNVDCTHFSVQTFDITQDPLKSDKFNAVMIKIHSNWGSEEYTDIYRVRIHGLVLE